jgi:hypothetical protein
MRKSNADICETCKFFHRLSVKEAPYQHFDSKNGIEIKYAPKELVIQCRYYPPTADGWPTVERDDWCGHHKRVKANDTE